MTVISSKAEFYGLWHAGRLGNRVRTWDGLEELILARFAGKAPAKVTVRVKTVGCNLSRYNVPITEVERAVGELANAGVDRRDITFNESCDDSRIVLQGELTTGMKSWYLLYSRDPVPMRVAMQGKNIRHLHGHAVLHLLRSVCDPSSFDCLMELLDTYPDSVVEFGVYDHPLGNIPRRNTIIWECRNY